MVGGTGRYRTVRLNSQPWLVLYGVVAKGFSLQEDSIVTVALGFGIWAHTSVWSSL